MIVNKSSENLQVKNVIEKPHNDHLPLIEASRFVIVPLYVLIIYIVIPFPISPVVYLE